MCYIGADSFVELVELRPFFWLETGEDEVYGLSGLAVLVGDADLEAPGIIYAVGIERLDTLMTAIIAFLYDPKFTPFDIGIVMYHQDIMMFEVVKVDQSAQCLTGGIHKRTGLGEHYFFTVNLPFCHVGFEAGFVDPFPSLLIGQPVYHDKADIVPGFFKLRSRVAQPYD
jgi:hypothetical protein